jgi:transmembrane 9 superfamily protein 2/4
MGKMSGFLILLAFYTVSALHFPGVAPKAYKKFDEVKLYVAKITSTRTQIPYSYYSLPYCKPEKQKLKSENVGEALEGDHIENSVYRLEMLNEKSCSIACIKTLSSKEKKRFIDAIEDEYSVHWLVDDLPVGHYSTDSFVQEKSNVDGFIRGFPVGFADKAGQNGGSASNRKLHFLNNHVRIIISYNFDDEGFLPELDMNFIGEENEKDMITKKNPQIVGFRVEPMSIKHNWERTSDASTIRLKTCGKPNPVSRDGLNFLSLEDLQKDEEIAYTYDVVFKASSVAWSNRWDIYLKAEFPRDQVHWFAIGNSTVVILLMTTMIAAILCKTVSRDILEYNNQQSIEEAKEESGWKLIHGDVFRPPKTSPLMLSVLIGTGVQLIGMSFALITFAFLGLLSPANRGSLVTALIILFVIMGSLAGYSSSMVYKMFRGSDWKVNTLTTAFFFPGTISSIFCVLNLILWLLGSSAALPFNAVFMLLFLWFAVSVPLVLIGSYFGYKRETLNFPVKTNLIPRQIPPNPWFMHPTLTSGIAGLMTFGVLGVELYFTMTAFWLHQYYYIFGFLLLCLIVLMITCAEISIIMCYVQLCFEDYQWWWRSFLHGGSSAGCIILYALWYKLTELDLNGMIPLFIYFSYMTMFAFFVFIITGTVGFFSCLVFNIFIYASLKVD